MCLFEWESCLTTEGLLAPVRYDDVEAPIFLEGHTDSHCKCGRGGMGWSFGSTLELQARWKLAKNLRQQVLTAR